MARTAGRWQVLAVTDRKLTCAGRDVIMARSSCRYSLEDKASSIDVIARIVARTYGPPITNYKSKWRNIWIQDVVFCQHLRCWGKNTCRIQDKEV